VAALIPGLGLENINWITAAAQIAMYVMWTLIVVSMLGMIGFFFWIGTYHIKVIYWDVTGDIDGRLNVGKVRKNRFGYKDRMKASWRPLFPLMSKDIIQPFDSKHIYGKQVYAYKYNGRYYPIQHGVTKLDDHQIMGTMTLIPNHAREWQALELKSNEIEFSKQEGWEMYKHAFLFAVVIIVCGAVFLGTLYLAYKIMAPYINQIPELTSAINKFSDVVGSNNAAAVPK